MADAGAGGQGSRVRKRAVDGLGAALLDTLFHQSSVGLHVLDTELRLVRVNLLTDMVPVGRLLGRRFDEAYRFDAPQETAELLREVLRTGVPVTGFLIRGRFMDADGPLRSLTVSVYRLDDTDGRPIGLLAAVVDVTDRENAQAREKILTAIREGVGNSLDVAATCRAFVDAVVPRFVDFAVIEVVDDVLRGADPPLGPLDLGVPLRRAAGTGFRGLGAEENQRGEEDAPRDEVAGAGHPAGDDRWREAVSVPEMRRLAPRTPYALAAADLGVRVVRLDADTPWLEADPEAARLIEATRAHSLMVVPLTLRGTVLGLLSLYRCEGTEYFDDADVSLARAAGDRVALSIDNARRYERDHVIASLVQRRLLPPDQGARTAVETAHVLLAGRNSGSWFDTIALSGGRTALVIGTVAGRGLQTAIVMGQLRTVIQALAGLDLEPDEVLARLKDTADHLAQERAALPLGDSLQKEELTATCMYGVYDPFTRTCAIARAGHPGPVVIGPDGTPVDADVPEGPGLFSAYAAPFAPVAITLEEGSVLAFFTGSFASGSGQPSASMKDALAHPDAPLQDLCDRVVYALPAGSHPDGAALLLARTGTVPADHVATWQLAYDRTTPSVARELVRERLEAWHLDEETVYATELIVSELITNAVRYGTPPLQLRLLLDRTLTCEVHDSSSVAPHLRHARTVDEGGRGLFIVSQLASHWGTRFSREGKALWTEQNVKRAEEEPATDSS
ncbi:SpoIIE family protein phosphatase [Streptomyces finlayi]|uniref:SpoIIE family protein phosphatase n=1 Tax=Streptomyces finlayi TaxID=67296 RepID=A0A7G7BJY0_9ACTN|nr:SpoIIE family protein phosphatase [Streptomyces finlayi]QNE75645.1 SpoIIE family protein phosphatase [Streptomyces finlayi]